MRIPDLTDMHSVSTCPPNGGLQLEQLGVDENGNVHFVRRDEDGDVVSSQSWAASTDAAATVHTMIEWLSRGAPGPLVAFEI